MLRPLLEQAADPMQSNGQIRLPRYVNHQNREQPTERALPNTAILFEPDVKFNQEFTAIVDACESKLKQEEKLLLQELNEYLDKNDKEISTNHIRLLCKNKNNICFIYYSNSKLEY